MSIIQRLPWTVQPQGPAKINTGSWQSNGLLHWWPLNGYTNDPHQGLNGSLVSGAAFGVDLYGKHLALDGTDDHLLIPSSVIAIGNNFTFSAQVNPSSIAARQTIWGCENTASGFQFEVAATTGLLSAIVNGLTVAVASTLGLSVNSWHDVVYTKNGNGAGASAIFVNGVKASLTTNYAQTFTDTASAHTIGRRASASQLFAGKIRDVRFNSYPMSNEQVSSLGRNRLELFAPQTRRIWVPVSAGGGAATHTTTGALTGAGSTVAGTAAHKAKHATTGVLTGPGSAVVGSAARTRQHSTSGVLTGPGSTVVGTAAHKAKHATTGALTGAGSEVVGSAARTRQHPSSGVLVGPGAVVAGVAAHVVAGGPHATTGALVGAGAVVAGTAAHKAKHATSGTLMGAGSAVAGVAARIAGAVTHATSGVLVGPSSLIVGVAQGPGVPLPETGGSTGGGGGGHVGASHRLRRREAFNKLFDDIKVEKPKDKLTPHQEATIQHALEVVREAQEAVKQTLAKLATLSPLPQDLRALQKHLVALQEELEEEESAIINLLLL